MFTFSIVIPFHNNEKQVKLCINSILKYFKININKYEIILVDDSTITRHSKAVKKFITNFTKLKIRIISNRKNLGPAASRNIGAKKAKFKYIFFLDSDTLLHKNIYNIIIKNLKKNDIVVGHYHFKPSNRSIAANFKAIYNYLHFSKKGIVKYETFNSACAIIKKKIFLNLNGFNRNIKWGMDYENEEFGRRIIKNNTIILDPSLTVMHEFPDFFNMLRLYYVRAIPYVGVILNDKKFENAGPGSSTIIPSIIFSILTTLSLFLNFFLQTNTILLCTIFFFLIFILMNLEFILFSLKIKPWQTPFFIIIKFILNHVLFIASNIGLLFYFFNKIRRRV